MSEKLRRLSRFYSSNIVPSAPQVVSTPDDVLSDVSSASGINSVGEDRKIASKTHLDLQPIYPRWHELRSGTCRTGNLSVIPSRGEEHDAGDTIRLYMYTVRDDPVEFGDPLVRGAT